MFKAAKKNQQGQIIETALFTTADEAHERAVSWAGNGCVGIVTAQSKTWTYAAKPTPAQPVKFDKWM